MEPYLGPRVVFVNSSHFTNVPDGIFETLPFCVFSSTSVATFRRKSSHSKTQTGRPVGFCLGLPTESNKWYSVVGVSGPILKSTTDITWGPGDRVSHPVRGRPGLWGDTAKRGRRMMFNHKGGPYSTRNSNLLSLITCVRILSHPQWRGRPQ